MQLKFFIENHGFKSDDQSFNNMDLNFRSDVNSGEIYRKLRETGIIDGKTVTLQLNADGAQCYEKKQV